MNKFLKIVKIGDMYEVRSKKGRRLGGPYKTKEDAVKRIRQIKFFERREIMSNNFYQNFAKSLLEDATTKNIAPVHKNVLNLPKGKHFWNVSLSHYINLAKKIGKAEVMRALNNLVRWNENKKPDISAKAKKIVNSLKNSKEWKNIPAKSK